MCCAQALIKPEHNGYLNLRGFNVSEACKQEPFLRGFLNWNQKVQRSSTQTNLS